MNRASLLSLLLFLVVTVALTGCRVFSNDIACGAGEACPSDLVCQSGLCVVDDGGGREGEEGEGEEGEGEGAQSEGEGEAVSCADDNGCDAGDVCVEGVCGKDCLGNGDDDCDDDEVCVFEGFFDVKAGCVRGCREAGNFGCGPGTPLCDPQSHGCRSAGGDGSVGALCVNSSECDGNFICQRFEGERFGFCTEECEEDPDEIGATDCTTFGCCTVSGLNRCSLGSCYEACDDTFCENGGAGCCEQTGLDACFVDLCVFKEN